MFQLIAGVSSITWGVLPHLLKQKLKQRYKTKHPVARSLQGSYSPGSSHATLCVTVVGDTGIPRDMGKGCWANSMGPLRISQPPAAASWYESCRWLLRQCPGAAGQPVHSYQKHYRDSLHSSVSTWVTKSHHGISQGSHEDRYLMVLTGNM